MYDQNAKSQRILTQLCTSDSEYVRERTTKFRLEILFESRVINLQISTTICHDFQYRVTNCSHWS